jgi:cytochrome bd ubiquinol oxidase subunit II
MDLPTLWYCVMGLALLAYTVLDGFDLGVGALHLFARTDEQRRIFLNAIGPVWDGNEVWIVIVMGGLFAGFPNAYATLFSGFYTLLMFLIAGLIFRAVAIEFRSKHASKTWRSTWDAVFSFASIVVALTIGLVLGNMIEGIPLNAEQDYIGSFSLFFRPYSLLMSVTATSLLAMHGTIYLAMKTEGAAHAVVRRWIHPAIFVFLFCYVIVTLATMLYMPHMLDRFYLYPALMLFPLLAALCIGAIIHQTRRRSYGKAFLASCSAIAFLLLLFSIGTYPTIIRSTTTESLTIYNSASSPKTLQILLLIVAIGLPFILAYGLWVYRVFRGKVRLGKTSY